MQSNLSKILSQAEALAAKGKKSKQQGQQGHEVELAGAVPQASPLQPHAQPQPQMRTQTPAFRSSPGDYYANKHIAEQAGHHHLHHSPSQPAQQGQGHHHHQKDQQGHHGSGGGGVNVDNPALAQPQTQQQQQQSTGPMDRSMLQRGDSVRLKDRQVDCI
jgi:hypothetical protein